MTYTLVFRVTKEVWDALERGEKKVEWRDVTAFWCQRLGGATQQYKGGGNVRALFICGKRQARFAVRGYSMVKLNDVPERWRGYLSTREVWAVELGERIA